jgi:hypothetical protein
MRFNVPGSSSVIILEYPTTSAKNITPRLLMIFPLILHQLFYAKAYLLNTIKKFRQARQNIQ